MLPARKRQATLSPKDIIPKTWIASIAGGVLAEVDAEEVREVDVHPQGAAGIRRAEIEDVIASSPASSGI